MKVTGKMSMFWSWKWFLSLCLAFSVLIVVFPARGTMVHAESYTANPLVMIAVDATNSNCIETFRANTDTRYPSVLSIPCPSGTIIGTEKIPLSQAKALHEAYVVLPPNNASPAVLRQSEQQIQQLMEAKTKQLRGVVKTKTNIPQVSCGSGGSLSVQHWDPDPTWNPQNYTSTEQFYRNTDCRHVTLEVASMSAYTVPNPGAGYDFWDHDQYESGWFGEPDVPTLVPNHHYSHNVDQVWDTGYYYQTWVHDPYYGESYYCNIGPIQ